MGRVGDLYFGKVIGKWVLEKGIKTRDRSIWACRTHHSREAPVSCPITPSHHFFKKVRRSYDEIFSWTRPWPSCRLQRFSCRGENLYAAAPTEQRPIVKFGSCSPASD